MNWPFHVDELDEDWPDPNVWEPMGTGEARGITAYLIQAGRPMLLSTDDWRRLAARGEIVMVGEESVTWLGVPLQSEGKTLGALVVQSYREETAHTEADKELLEFVGRHIASALERTRLIDETRQRNAELSLINDVQRGLAMNLDMQAMYDLVGDRLQEIFDAQVVDIGVLDETAGLIHFPYTIEKGVRFPDEPMAVIGFRKHVLETREPLLFERRHARDARRVRPAGSHPGRAREVRRVRAAGGRGQGDRGDLAPERRPRARVRRRRPPAPDDARGEPERRARERPAVRGDPPAQRRARADQRRAARPGREPRDAGDVRPRRRPAPGDLRRPGRRHRGARPRPTDSSASRTSIETGRPLPDEPIEPDRVPQARPRDARAAPDRRAITTELLAEYGQPRSARGRAAKSVGVRPTRRRRARRPA